MFKLISPPGGDELPQYHREHQQHRHAHHDQTDESGRQLHGLPEVPGVPKRDLLRLGSGGAEQRRE